LNGTTLFKAGCHVDASITHSPSKAKPIYEIGIILFAAGHNIRLILRQLRIFWPGILGSFTASN
jgi:hypothetical protein